MPIVLSEYNDKMCLQLDKAAYLNEIKFIASYWVHLSLLFCGCWLRRILGLPAYNKQTQILTWILPPRENSFQCSSMLAKNHGQDI